jgi:hypothetical protein
MNYINKNNIPSNTLASPMNEKNIFFNKESELKFKFDEKILLNSQCKKEEEVNATKRIEKQLQTQLGIKPEVFAEYDAKKRKNMWKIMVLFIL